MPASEPKLVYIPHPDATPVGELSALSVIYGRAIERYEESQRGGPETAPEDAMKGPKHDRASADYTGT